MRGPHGSVQQGHVHSLGVRSPEVGEWVRFVREVIGEAVYVKRAGLCIDADRLPWNGSAEHVRGFRDVGIRARNDQRVVVARYQEDGGRHLEQLADHFSSFGGVPLVRPGTIEQIARHQNRVNLVLASHFREVAESLEYGL